MANNCLRLEFLTGVFYFGWTITDIDLSDVNMTDYYLTSRLHDVYKNPNKIRDFP